MWPEEEFRTTAKYEIIMNAIWIYPFKFKQILDNSYTS